MTEDRYWTLQLLKVAREQGEIVFDHLGRKAARLTNLDYTYEEALDYCIEQVRRLRCDVYVAKSID